MVAMATFFIVLVIPGQKSGERLQDHWPSGLLFYTSNGDKAIVFLFFVLPIFFATS